jgi:hypothetical protein
VVSAAGYTILGRRIINKHTLKTPSKVPWKFAGDD